MPRLRRIAAALALTAVVGATAGCSLLPGASEASASTVLSVGTRASGPAVAQTLLGGNGHWQDDAFGAWDAQRNEVYPGFVTALQQAGIGSIRYPAGTAANLFHFQRAIGPQAQRQDQVGWTHGFPDHGLDSRFGPDEYGALLQRLHIPGSVVANFGDGTPAEAAAFVEYMTGTPGRNLDGGVDWAAVRARNGHPAPYDIPYWEVGNEAHSGHQLYWRSGTSASDTTKLYAFGGSTRFTHQRVGTATDYNAKAAVSTGRAGQRFQAYYPPVAPGSATVSVGGSAWRQVGSLAAESGSAHVYTLDGTTGAILFGNGHHGAVPAKGAVVTISYTSGPHAGFTAFYAAMKKANPDIHVCEALNDPGATAEFARLMGSGHPYDCAEWHAYVNAQKTTLPSKVSADAYHEELMSHVADQVGGLQAIRKAIDANAGSRAKQVQVVVTEYGQLGGAPKGVTDWHRSLSEALLMGNDLVQWIRAGVPLADKSNLNGYGRDADGGKGNLDSMILRGGTSAGPTFSLASTGLVSGVFRPLVGGTPRSTAVTGNPSRTAPGSGRTLPALSTVATRSTDGSLHLVVVNDDPTSAVRTLVRPGVTHGSAASTITLTGPSVSATTTTGVKRTSAGLNAGSGDFTTTFPARSITEITLPPR